MPRCFRCGQEVERGVKPSAAVERMQKPLLEAGVPVLCSDCEPSSNWRAIGETPSAYRVWFDDGSATLIDALGEVQARCIIEAGISEGKYHGTIRRIEKL